MKVSDMMQTPPNPKASQASGGQASGGQASGAENARYRDYVIEQQSNGKEALPFDKWYELRQQGKL